MRSRQAIEEEQTLADSLAPTGDADRDKRAKKRCEFFSIPVFCMTAITFCRLEEQIARMKKNQERRLHRKNAKIVKEGGTPMQLDRPMKPDTTVREFLRFLTILTLLFSEALRPLWPNGSHE